MESNSNKQDYLSIKRIKVEKLFGDFTYELPPKNDVNINNSNIFILYGDNGSGKTTILNMVYHLLNPIDNKGHKSFLAKIRFKTFKVQLTNGISIIAQREESDLIGSYTLTLTKDSKKIESVFLKADEDLIIKAREEKQKKIKNILKYLSKLDYDLYFISDDRDFSSNIFERYEREDDLDFVIRDIGFERKYLSKRRQPQDLRRFIMRQAIDRAEKYLISEVNKALSKGEINVNKIYSDIIHTIVNPNENLEIESKSIKDFKDKLIKLFKRSEDYSRFKIYFPFNIEDIIIAINKAHQEEFKTIITILKPYIEGIEAKLNALEDIYDLLRTFTTNLNDFYSYKKVEFEVNEGIVILSKNQILNPGLLSSGEKQLLMMFCNILLARRRNSIFIIDEPELSLNVQWKRKLIQAILDLTKDCQVQFILATHSIEILTQYQENVAPLKQIE